MSSPAIDISVSGQAITMLSNLADPKKVGQVIAHEVDRQNELTVSHVQRKYLSFPHTKRVAGRATRQPTTMEGLRVISNRLRSSIRRTKALVKGEAIDSSIGSNVVYAGIHEFGGRIQIPPRQGRVNLVEGRFGTDQQVRRAFRNLGRRAVRRVLINGRGYTINMPARSYLRRGISDRTEQMGKGVSRAIVDYASAGGDA